MEIDRMTPDAAVLAELGRRLALVRKQRRWSQLRLADEAGIGVATLRRIEDGKDSRLGSWLRILRALELEGRLDELLPEAIRSPMADAVADRPKRRRSPSSEADSSPGIVWGDEQQ